MRLHDTLPIAPQGIFALDIYLRGQLVERYEDRNLIVETGRAIQAQLLGGDVAGRSIARIAFGTRATAPAPGDTAITGSFAKPIDGHTYPSPTTVAFQFSLGSQEANGLSIIEFGLLTGNGTLYSRKVRQGAIVKEVDLTLTGTWQIIF